MSTLEQRFDPRRNSFDLLRVLFAALVAVSHGLFLYTGHQPRWGRSTLGDFALDGFFILSGFLVTRSYLTLNSLPRYAWHRMLRIMPGFWVCLLFVALVIAPATALAQGLPASTPFLGDPSAQSYLLGNAALLITQYDIAGLLDSTPGEPSYNGSLWTLAFEALCYGLVVALGVLGLLRRRQWVLVLVAGLALLTLMQEAGVPVLLNDRVLRLTYVFLLGSVAMLFAHRIPMRIGIAGLAAVAFLLSVVTLQDYRAAGAIPLAYLFLWFGTCFPRPWSMRTDISYGVYIYHWPVFQLLVVIVGAGAWPTPVFVITGIALAVFLGLLSWFTIEKPALRLKHSPVLQVMTAWFGRGIARRSSAPRAKGSRELTGDQPARPQLTPSDRADENSRTQLETRESGSTSGLPVVSSASKRAPS